MILLFTGSYAHAQSASLTVCNKGSLGIAVATAENVEIFPGTIDVSGWTVISPGKCEVVYSQDGVVDPAYVLLFRDSQHHLMATHANQVPDLGWNNFRKVLTKSDKQFCVRDSSGFLYRTHSDSAGRSCASFHYGANDPGGYYPRPSAFYFDPVSSKCSQSLKYGPITCNGGDYYLNVEPQANDTELHASVATERGGQSAADTGSLGTKILNGLGQAMRKQQQEQGEPAFCVPGELLSDWRNPPHGSKMQGFKARLKKAFAENDLYTNSTMQWYIKLGVFMHGYTPASDLRDVVYPEPAGHECNPPGRLERLP